MHHAEGMNAVRAVVLAALALLGQAASGAEPPLRTGTITLGVPRADFVVLGADRLWSRVSPRADDLPSERHGRQVKIAVHESLPLAVAVAGVANLGPDQDTVAHIRRLIATVDPAGLSFDTLVERLRTGLQEPLQAVRAPARRALARNPRDVEAAARLKAARLTLLVGLVAGRQATLGSIELVDQWKATLIRPPRGAVAWPDALEAYYRRGPYAGAAQMFGYGIRAPDALAAHVRRVIEGGIREDARLYRDGSRHVAGPVDVVVIDARGVRCVPPCGTP